MIRPGEKLCRCVTASSLCADLKPKHREMKMMLAKERQEDSLGIGILWDDEDGR